MRKDITGERFGRSVATSCTGEKRWGVYLWSCQCDCGKTHVAAVNSLRSGLVRSCGCLRDEKASESSTRHGGYGSPTYKSWDAMIQRCCNPNSASFPRYGALGITVCEGWRDYKNFMADMGRRPDGTTLDRIDSHGNYEPGNCRWASDLVQARNKRKRTTTFDEAEQVRAMYATTRKPKTIASELGLTRGSVNGVVYLGQVTEPLA